MNCYICLQTCNNSNNLCECSYDCSCVHTSCIMKWIYISNKYVCGICGKKYSLPYIFRPFFFLKKMSKIFWDSEILEYDLYTGIRWDAYD